MAEHVNRHGARALGGSRKILTQQRIRRGHASGFADASGHPRGDQLHEVRDVQAHHDSDAPQTNCQRGDRDTVAAIGPAGDWQAKRRIEESEGNAGEKSQLGIGELEILFDGLQEQDDQTTIEVVECVDQREYAEDVALVRL